MHARVDEKMSQCPGAGKILVVSLLVCHTVTPLEYRNTFISLGYWNSPGIPNYNLTGINMIVRNDAEY